MHQEATRTTFLVALVKLVVSRAMPDSSIPLLIHPFKQGAAMLQVQRQILGFQRGESVLEAEMSAGKEGIVNKHTSLLRLGSKPGLS